MKKMKEMLTSPYMIAILFAIKMMIYYSLIEVNQMEIILIIISLSVWAFIFICFGKSGLKRKRGIFLLVYILFSLLMFADTMYYNYYNQTVSIKQLWQAKSVTAVPRSFLATLIPSSFLLFIDIPFTYRYFKKYSSAPVTQAGAFRRRLKNAFYVITVLLITLVANPFHSAAIERVNSMEFFTNHVTDIYETISDRINPLDMEEDEILKVIDEMNPDNELVDRIADDEEPEDHGQNPVSNEIDDTEPAVNEIQPEDTEDTASTRFRDIGKGRNLIVIQLEAFQDFVIGAEYEGQELTPNLNRLLQQDTINFDRYYTNTGKGNTADAEFTSMNSLYPLIDGEIYRLYEDNTFHGLPWLLREQGYHAFAVHGYKGEFWNRENAYPYQGFEDYISMEDLSQDEIIGMGISDKSMFKQLIEILKEQQEPYFTFVITLTNHHPYVLDEQYRSLILKEEDMDTTFGSYLQTIRYTDEALGQFIEELKEAGLYEDTVIAMYGDHHGLNCGMEELQVRMTQYLGRNYDYDEMLNVPLIIHVPGSGVKETISTVGGQIDFMPTIANIMGLNLDRSFILGQDLGNAAEGFVAFTTYLFEGSFAKDDVIFQISREGIFEGSRAWRIGTGEVLDASLYREEYEKALLLKKTSEEILEQDLISRYIEK